MESRSKVSSDILGPVLNMWLSLFFIYFNIQNWLDRGFQGQYLTSLFEHKVRHQYQRFRKLTAMTAAVVCIEAMLLTIL